MVSEPTAQDATSLTWNVYDNTGAVIGTEKSASYSLTNGFYKLVYTATNTNGSTSVTVDVLCSVDEMGIASASTLFADENAVIGNKDRVSIEANAKANGYAIYEDGAIKLASNGAAWQALYRFPKINLGAVTATDEYFVFDVYNPTSADVSYYFNNVGTWVAKPGFNRVSIATKSFGASYLTTENGNVYLYNATAGSRIYLCVNAAATLYFSGFRISNNVTDGYVSLADYEGLYVMTDESEPYTLPVCNNAGYTVTVKEGETNVPVTDNKITVSKTKTYAITYTVPFTHNIVATKTITVCTTDALVGETLLMNAKYIVDNTPERNPATDSTAGKMTVYENAYFDGYAKYEQNALAIFSKAANIYIRLPQNVALGTTLTATRYLSFDVYNPQETNVTMAGISAASLVPGWNTVKIKLSDLANKTQLKDDGQYYLANSAYLGINVNQNHNASYVGTGVTLYFSGLRITNEA